MTGQQLLDGHLTQILDGESLGDEIVLSIFNLGKTSLELKRSWRFLMAEDSSLTVSPGNTLTTMKNLPTSFGVDVKMYIGAGFTEYHPVLFENRRITDSGHYYIDHGNSQFAIIGDVSEVSTIYFNYSILTPDLAALDESFSTRWKDTFLPIIAYQGAAIYRGGVDWDSENARMSPENRAAATMLYNAMLQLDNRQLLRALNNPYAPREDRIPHTKGADRII